MPEIKWIRLQTDIFDDEKIRLIEAMPDADTLLIIWVRLLCQAGKVNAGGYIFLTEDIPFTEENLATLFNRPLNTVRLALSTFSKLRMIEVDNKGIFLPNWTKHQNIEGMERIKELSRQRQQRFRDRKLLRSGSSNVTSRYSNSTDKNKNREEIKNKENNNFINKPYRGGKKRVNVDDMETANRETISRQSIPRAIEIARGEVMGMPEKSIKFMQDKLDRRGIPWQKKKAKRQ